MRYSFQGGNLGQATSSRMPVPMKLEPAYRISFTKVLQLSALAILLYWAAPVLTAFRLTSVRPVSCS
jgi:hypothetical protein